MKLEPYEWPPAHYAGLANREMGQQEWKCRDGNGTADAGVGPVSIDAAVSPTLKPEIMIGPL
jgi:hypothetical protein